MRQYKIIARILLILPIINFAFALPIAAQETRQVCGDVVPDVAITMSAKRGVEMENGMYFERLSGKPDSDLTGLKGPQPEVPDHGSMDPPQMGTSEIQQVSPDLSKSPSLGHYLGSPESETPFASADDSLPVASTDSELYSSPSAANGYGRLTTSSPIEQPKCNGLLCKVVSKVVSKVSKLKFWRRISGPGSVRDAVNAARGLVDTGAYVSASSPESQTF
jgi:hypothetical protein